MQLTPHFTLEEFEYSSTALARGIDVSGHLGPVGPIKTKSFIIS